jgi:hypothetical protein
MSQRRSTSRLVTNQPLYTAIGIPMLFNAALLASVMPISIKTGKIEDRLTAIDKRFDDMRDLWRAAL